MDFKQLAADLGLEINEFVELIDLFITTATADLHELEKALSNGNVDQTICAAHSIKGSAANLGFLELSELAGQIEKNARCNRLTGLETPLSVMQEHLQHIGRHLTGG